jgi:hypothetical protein
MSAVLAKVMHEMGLPPAWITELSQIPRKTVDDIIKGNGPWAEMPRNELYDRATEQPPRKQSWELAKTRTLWAVSSTGLLGRSYNFKTSFHESYQTVSDQPRDSFTAINHQMILQLDQWQAATPQLPIHPLDHFALLRLAELVYVRMQ